MPSTYSPRIRAEKQEPGENNNTWGARLNDNTIEMIDEAIDGVTTITSSGAVTLSVNEAATDQARKRVLLVTSASTGATITIPNVEKNYIVINQSSGSVVITTGSGTTATVRTGNAQQVVCIGSNTCIAVALTDHGTADLLGGSFLASGPTVGIGYRTGAGGTVNQATSKTTNVSINKVCGSIVTHNSSLASQATATFSMVNSTIGPRDLVLLNVATAASGNAYRAWISSNNGSGTIGIMLQNVSAGALAEAVTISFAVIKGVTS